MSHAEQALRDVILHSGEPLLHARLLVTIFRRLSRDRRFAPLAT
ncbi:protein of unknown function (plasmid) [Caballeronia sp. S22]